MEQRKKLQKKVLRTRVGLDTGDEMMVKPTVALVYMLLSWDSFYG